MTVIQPTLLDFCDTVVDKSNFRNIENEGLVELLGGRCLTIAKEKCINGVSDSVDWVLEVGDSNCWRKASDSVTSTYDWLQISQVEGQ